MYSEPIRANRKALCTKAAFSKKQVFFIEKGLNIMPRVRTVPKAVAEIQAADPNTFITEPLIRRWIADGYIKLIPGCRAYKLVDLDQIETFIADNCRA